MNNPIFIIISGRYYCSAKFKVTDKPVILLKVSYYSYSSVVAQCAYYMHSMPKKLQPQRKEARFNLKDRYLIFFYI